MAAKRKTLSGASAPYVQQHGESLKIVRFVNGQHQFWNGLRCEWIKAADVHGPSANNPKISYFRSPAAVELELDIIARHLTPEAAAEERQQLYNAKKRERYRHARTNDRSSEPRPQSGSGGPPPT